jgi:CHAD domain-containing protein
MDEPWERFLKAAKTSKSSMDEESIHHLRISVRRLSAAFELVRLFLPEIHTEKTGESLKEMRRILGPLRDIQVQMILAGDLADTAPDFPKFEKYLFRCEKEERRKLAKKIQKHVTKLGKHFTKTMNSGRELLGMFTPFEAERTIVNAVDEAFGKVLDRKRTVERRDVSAIHELRTRFKRFRYAVEAARTIFPDASDEQIAHMRELQQLMGNVHDIEVLVDTFSTWEQKKKKVKMAHPPVYEMLAQRRRESIDCFLARIREINTFAQPGFAQDRQPAVPIRIVQ